ncbi:30S ribosomal protein S17 [Acidihalobacter prosperus]
MSEATKVQRSVVGRVLSDKMDKTLTVEIKRMVRHPVYGKYIRRSTKLHVHDADNNARAGDTVRIQECRPISRSKSWKLVEIVERSPE